MEKENDPINPKHYKSLFELKDNETIAVTRQLDFCAGNYYKYLARLYKKDDPVQDFQKARWYAKDWVQHHYERDAHGLLINPCGVRAAIAFDFIQPPEEGTELYDRYELMRIVTQPLIDESRWRVMLLNYEHKYLIDKEGIK